MDWLAIATMLWVGGLASPFFYVAWREVRKLRRGREEGHEQHAAWMDGLAEGAGLDERDKREELRRRLFLR